MPTPSQHYQAGRFEEALEAHARASDEDKLDPYFLLHIIFSIATTSGTVEIETLLKLNDAYINCVESLRRLGITAKGQASDTINDAHKFCVEQTLMARLRDTETQTVELWSQFSFLINFDPISTLSSALGIYDNVGSNHHYATHLDAIEIAVAGIIDKVAGYGFNGAVLANRLKAWKIIIENCPQPQIESKICQARLVSEEATREPSGSLSKDIEELERAIAALAATRSPRSPLTPGNSSFNSGSSDSHNSPGYSSESESNTDSSASDSESEKGAGVAPDRVTGDEPGSVTEPAPRGWYASLGVQHPQLSSGLNMLTSGAAWVKNTAVRGYTTARQVPQVNSGLNMLQSGATWAKNTAISLKDSVSQNPAATAATAGLVTTVSNACILSRIEADESPALAMTFAASTSLLSAASLFALTYQASKAAEMRVAPTTNDGASVAAQTPS